MWNILGSSQSSSNSASSGDGKYDPVLGFDPDVFFDPQTRRDYTHNSLLKVVEDFPEMKNEQISTISIYKHKLEDNWQNSIPFISSWQNIKLFRFHAFIVFQTDQDWYYSLEKYQQRVSLQRARKIEGVRDLDARFSRLNEKHGVNAEIKEIKNDYGKGTVEDLIKVIIEEKLVSTEYNWMTENCKHLAACIYNRASEGTCSLAWREDADLPHQCTLGG